MKPELIVTLGKKALDAMIFFYSNSKKLQEYKKKKMKECCAKLIKDKGIIPILPLYHTSNLAKSKSTGRSEPNQEKDWKKINQYLK